MCMSKKKKSPVDTAAADNRALEAQKQAQIAAEVGNINNTFANYNDDYFKGVSGAYVKHYQPELTKQYQTARENLIYAQPGGGQGSAYNQALASLDEENAKHLADLQNGANSYASDYRRNVEGERSSLMNMASLNAGSGAAAQQAVNTAKALATPPAYSALGDLFAKIAGNASLASQAQDKAKNAKLLTSQLDYTRTAPGTVIMNG